MAELRNPDPDNATLMLDPGSIDPGQELVDYSEMDGEINQVVGVLEGIRR